MVVPPVEVMFMLHLKKNPSPFMVGDGALDVPLHEVMFTLHPKKKPSRFRLRKQPA